MSCDDNDNKTTSLASEIVYDGQGIDCSPHFQIAAQESVQSLLDTMMSVLCGNSQQIETNTTNISDLTSTVNNWSTSGVHTVNMLGTGAPNNGANYYAGPSGTDLEFKSLYSTDGSILFDDTDPNSVDIRTAPGAGLPSGAIIMWSGSVIPAGFRLCDGTYGTPDLMGRFIVGYHYGAVTSPTVATNKEMNYGQIGNTGGELAHTLTAAEGSVPSHNHSLSNVQTDLDGNHYHESWASQKWTGALGGNRGMAQNSHSIWPEGYRNPSVFGPAYVTMNDGVHRHNLTGNTDLRSANASQSHENRPPYYVLMFIQKI